MEHKQKIYQALLLYAKKMKHNIIFKYDYIKIIRILSNYPIEFSTNVNYYIHINKILLDQVLMALPTVELVVDEQKYIEKLSKKYNVNINEITLGSTVAFFSAVSKGENIDEKTFSKNNWYYLIPQSKPAPNGKVLNILEPYSFSKKEYSKSVEVNNLNLILKDCYNKRGFLLIQENALSRIKQENDQEKRMIIMGERQISEKYIRYLDISIYINEQKLQNIQEKRIILDYKITDLNNKIELIKNEISLLKEIRKNQIYTYTSLKRSSIIKALWYIQVELSKYDTKLNDNVDLVKHI